MIKVSELTGAQLDYYVAKAERFQWRCPWMLEKEGFREWQKYEDAWGSSTPRYSTDWAEGGPLLHKYEISTEKMSTAWLTCLVHKTGATIVSEGDTPLQAICRSVVRTAFGEEVEEVEGV